MLKIRKKLRKVVTIVACLAVVIVTVACDKKTRTNSEKTDGTGWPPSEARSPHGLRDMSQPTGASDITWGSIPILTIYFKGTNATHTAIRSWFNTEKWSEEERLNMEEQKIYLYKKGEYGANYVYNQGNIQLNAGKGVN